MVVGALGCEKEATFVEPLPDYAAIHWVNAVPDTMQQDYRVVDIVSNAGLFDANFRATNMFYQGIEAGNRTVRVFLSSTNPAIASQVLEEESLQLTEGASYTFIHAGFARTGQTPARAVIVLQDTPPIPAASDIGLRVVNAAAGLGNVDVWVVKRPVNPATADSLPDARGVTALPFGTAAAYLTLARDAVAADSVRVVYTAAGQKSPILASTLVPTGAVGDSLVNPIAGARQGGSVLTAVLVPRSVAGSTAPAAFTTPTVVYLVDRRPLNTAP